MHQIFLFVLPYAAPKTGTEGTTFAIGSAWSGRHHPQRRGQALLQRAGPSAPQDLLSGQACRFQKVRSNVLLGVFTYYNSRTQVLVHVSTEPGFHFGTGVLSHSHVLLGAPPNYQRSTNTSWVHKIYVPSHMFSGWRVGSGGGLPKSKGKPR